MIRSLNLINNVCISQQEALSLPVFSLTDSGNPDMSCMYLSRYSSSGSNCVIYSSGYFDTGPFVKVPLIYISCAQTRPVNTCTHRCEIKFYTIRHSHTKGSTCFYLMFTCSIPMHFIPLLSVFCWFHLKNPRYNQSLDFLIYSQVTT